MEYLGFLLELLFLALGIYLYLFARGMVKTGDAERQRKAEAFRQQNAGWMRILGLALAAIMLLNVIVHLRQLLA